MENKKITIESLAVMVQKGFESIHGEMNTRFDVVDKQFEQVDKRFKQIDDQFLNVNARLDTIQIDFSMQREDRHRIKLLEDDVALIKKKI